MSRVRGAHETQMSHRSKVVDDGEPILTERRTVQPGNGELRQNIPTSAVDILGLGKSTELSIEIYDDGYFVSVSEE